MDPIQSISHDLFQPIRIGSLSLRGRLVKSATVETMCTPDGEVTEKIIDFYQTIARGGTPMIITGASSYNRYARGVPHQLAVDSDERIAGLRRLSDAVHQYDSKIFLQIYHTARQAIPGPVGRTDAQAPSAVYEPTLGVRPRAMTVAEIDETITQFADAAERAQKAGMDGIQIHAAHGYLISSFLTPHTNRRKDDWGGSLENRMRLLVRTYQAVRQRVGPGFPVILKLNGSDDLPMRRGLKTAELFKIAKIMEGHGIDAVEISTGFYESGTTFSRGRWNGYTRAVMDHGPGQAMHPIRRKLMTWCAPLVDFYFNRVSAYSEGFNLDQAQIFTAGLSIPVICVGGFVSEAAMKAALDSGQCDLVSVARGFVADPYLYDNLRLGRDRPKCNHCNACFTKPGSRALACSEPDVSRQRATMLANTTSRPPLSS